MIGGAVSEIADSDLTSEGVWQCPHDVHGSADHCLFHLPPTEIDDSTVREAFLDKLERHGRSEKQFIGARFGTLDLAHATLESVDNHPIDLRYASFEGTARLTYAIVRQPLQLEGVRFGDRAEFTETRFRNEVYLSGAQFEGGVRFTGATFGEGGWFYNCSFGTADLAMTTVEGRADFTEATFERTHLREARFKRPVTFSKARFEQFSAAGVIFEESVSFEGATLPSTVTFRHGTFRDTTTFSDLIVPELGAYVDLRDATIEDGALYQPDSGTAVYDLKDATLRTVDLAPGSPPIDLLGQYRFRNTAFDGFDFSQYRLPLAAADWQLHGVTTPPGLDVDLEVASDDDDLEGTYLKAKNGANTIGDATAAAEFFRREMLHRRQSHRKRAGDVSLPIRTRVHAGWEWFSNLLLDLSSGYGEQPSRVILASVSTILLFTGIFALVQGRPPYGEPLGFVLVSLESFITLVLGGAAPIEDPRVRLLAQVEGFIGAFLIALFVFTLTRAIHR